MTDPLPPLTAAEIAHHRLVAALSHNAALEVVRRLCASHERLRAALAGARAEAEALRVRNEMLADKLEM